MPEFAPAGGKNEERGDEYRLFHVGQAASLEALMQETPALTTTTAVRMAFSLSAGHAPLPPSGLEDKTCVYDECPYCMEPVSTRRPALDDEPER
jgi:hypothetical protein